tara:strand:- start:32511 stop:32762 length:252 start_codon:yes stop_codon:yes gene_type:complete
VNDLIYQGCFAVVDVGDDGYVPNSAHEVKVAAAKVVHRETAMDIESPLIFSDDCVLSHPDLEMFHLSQMGALFEASGTFKKMI